MSERRARIVWGENPPPQPERSIVSAPVERGMGTAKIAWAGTAQTSNRMPDLNSLIGVEDAFDHSPILAGEKVAYCHLDSVVYHLQTFRFLQNINQGRCCVCGQSAHMKMLLLPDTHELQKGHPAAQPVYTPAGGDIIHLADVPNFLFQAVTVQDYIFQVYCTRNTGAYFLRFEPHEIGLPVFAGFKVVIFQNYVSRWTERGLNIRQMYENRQIRVRGIVQEHIKWGVEILVNSPQMIEVIAEGSQPGKE